MKVWSVLIMGILVLAGCKSGVTANKAEVASAREAALAEAPALDDQSKKMISENNPKFEYHRLAGPYAQYSFSWQISSNRTFVLYGDGDVKKLENHNISVH